MRLHDTAQPESHIPDLIAVKAALWWTAAEGGGPFLAQNVELGAFQWIKKCFFSSRNANYHPVQPSGSGYADQIGSFQIQNIKIQDISQYSLSNIDSLIHQS